MSDSIANAGGDPNLNPNPDPKADPNPDPDPKADPNPDPDPKVDPDPKKDFKTKRPDFVPEKFWNEDDSEVRMEDVFKSYGELEKKLHEKQQTEGVPEKPDGYKFEPTKDMTEKGLEIQEDDVVLANYRNFALENEIPQAQFQKNVEFFIDAMQKQAENSLLNELIKIGKTDKDVKQRVGALNKWAAANLSKDGYQKYVNALTTADAVEVFEELRTKMSTQRRLPDGDGSNISHDLTEKELHGMMKDERYWHPKKRDPAFIEKVTDGFQKLYSE